MPEHIDIMTPAVDRGAQFTVNIAAPSVPIVPVPAAISTLYSGDGKSEFVHNDNYIILSVGYLIPESFCIANYDIPSVPADNMAVPQVLLSAYGLVSLVHHPVLGFGTDGQMRLPFPNYEFSVGIFIDVNTGHSPFISSEGFELRLQFPVYPGAEQANISMQNVPAGLDGQVIYVTPFLKVLHNLPLT